MTIIVIWELAYKFASFPSLVDVYQSIVKLTTNNTLGVAILISLKRLVIGFIISLFIGSLIGLLIVKLKHSRDSLGKLIGALQSMPNVCWVPFAVLWFGLNEKAILFVIIIGSVFAVSMAIESGIKNFTPIYIRVAEMAGAKGFALYKEVIFPESIPVILAGVRQGWAFAWRGLIAGEMIASSMNGLGQILTEGKKYNDINQIVAVMVVIIILGLIIDKFVFENIENAIGRKYGFVKS
ncbi:ABC transporter permease [Clostridium sp. DJ247]|uniref:ABC transporter permease n=1 Tax=Clostridium sp. DJ247 TaxID=2726188 RepID=UPI001F4CCB7E|nr:ABC transporter permease subunit [Clostridium sp. DJ247]